MQGCFICFNISNGVSLLEIISQRVSGWGPGFSLKIFFYVSQEIRIHSQAWKTILGRTQRYRWSGRKWSLTVLKNPKKDDETTFLFISLPLQKIFPFSCSQMIKDLRVPQWYLQTTDMILSPHPALQRTILKLCSPFSMWLRTACVNPTLCHRPHPAASYLFLCPPAPEDRFPFSDLKHSFQSWGLCKFSSLSLDSLDSPLQPTLLLIYSLRKSP